MSTLPQAETPTMTASSPMMLHGPCGPVTYPIQLKVYDLSRGIAKQCTGIVLGKKIPAVYHTGLCVYGREYWFGPSGIMCAPDEFWESTNRMEPLETIKGMCTNLHLEQFERFLRTQECSYTKHHYHLSKNNCNNFAQVCLQYLTAGSSSVPCKIMNQPWDIAQCPHAYRFVPLVDMISKNMSGDFDADKIMKDLALDKPSWQNGIHRWGMSKVGQQAFREILEAIQDALSGQTQTMLILNPFGEGYVVKLDLPKGKCEDVEAPKTDYVNSFQNPYPTPPQMSSWNAPAPAPAPQIQSWNPYTTGRVQPPHADV